MTLKASIHAGSMGFSGTTKDKKFYTVFIDLFFDEFGKSIL